LLPSGPGGVRRFSLRGAQPSTPPHEAHSTRHALGRGFNPARADCGLQGTATSPSSTATSRPLREESCNWRRGRDSNPRHSCPCTAFPVPHLRPLGHPSASRRGPLVTPRKCWRRGEDLNPRGTYAPIRFRVGRLQPGSATPPRTLSVSLRYRLGSKNALSSAAASSASTPPVAVARWFIRTSSRSRYSDATAPAFGSRAP
jgi:hypothetical protein